MADDRDKKTNVLGIMGGSVVSKSTKIFLSLVVFAAGLLSTYGTNPFNFNPQTANLLIFLGLIGVAFFSLEGR